MEAAFRQQNMQLPLCFTGVPANHAKALTLQKLRKRRKGIVFYSSRRDSAIPKSAPSEAPKCRNHCILGAQMRFCSGAKMCTKRCGVRSLSRFTIRNAIAENRNRRIEAQNGNVSKPSALSMKVTCRMSKGRNEAAKTGKIAETFG